MKKCCFLLFLAIPPNSFAITNNNSGSDKTTPSLPSVTAGCAPATAATQLDINNIRALIMTGGDMWWDLQSSPHYEVPKGSGKNALFSGALWLGGVDVSNQLKVAAQRYRSNGNDFWPGPLSTVNFEIDAGTCVEYDRHYRTYRHEIAEFAAWYNCKEDPNCNAAIIFPNYQIPQIILEWPAHGRNYAPYDEDFYLAPFYDREGDGIYNPLHGDYPGYDLGGSVPCNTSKIDHIYGDQNLWWIFNDKGNIHTESGAQAIGMEIRAQAFAFATNDEVNNMTFYNFELVNRSTYTLKDTYFGIFVDADLGCYEDDYVGCDVMRGLGYCYNGDAFDEDCGGANGYGQQPPAIGVDFFQGPFQDADGIDNQVGIGKNEALNGVGYGDGIPDNERFGMRRFIYFNRIGSDETTDPETGTEYYNYLRGMWANGTKMTYGGTGYSTSASSIHADFMFPDNTDPFGWGTGGVPQPAWSDGGNAPGDRRFLQSAGPFTLTPGAVNNITVGVVWAEASSGGPWASVQALRKADDKTQAMFDNCFKVLDGPDAPKLSLQELNKEIILYISNPKTSNNYNEEYVGIDPFLIPPDSVDTNNNGINDIDLTEEEKIQFSSYYFQGYQIFQVKDKTISAADLHNPDKARLVAQCDLKDGIEQIVNFYEDDELGALIPMLEVDGADKGIFHSFRILEDKFATGDKRLVNHKTYYYMAIAYAYNFSPYSAFDPMTDGDNAPSKQKRPYLASRKSVTGSIKVYSAIPHIPQPEAHGTYQNAQYGDGVELTRIEGQGNGGQVLNFTQKTINKIMSGPPWESTNPTYKAGEGPLTIKVVDPLNVPPGDFTIQFKDSETFFDLKDATWEMWMDFEPGNVISSDKTIAIGNEQVLIDWGISITAEQSINTTVWEDNPTSYATVFLQATMTFADEEKQWLTGIPNMDGFTQQNWIRSGKHEASDNEDPTYDDNYSSNIPNTSPPIRNFSDPEEIWETVLGGTWAPYKLAALNHHGPAINQLALNFNRMDYLQSIDIVLTTDKSKWTRCPVIEMQEDPKLAEDDALKGLLRSSQSVDKEGNADGTGMGMSWFPGYAICLETGERLNMAFGEDSWLQKENGRDMLWNPTTNIFEGMFDDIRFGGKHYIFVFRNNIVEEEEGSSSGPANPDNRMPAYDEGQFAHNILSAANNPVDARNVWRAAMWVGLPLLAESHQLLETEVTISIRVTKPYEGYGTSDYLNPGDALSIGKVYFVDKGPIEHSGITYNRGEYFTAESTTFTATGLDLVGNLMTTINAGNPMYTFSTHDLAVTTESHNDAVDALDLINVVPNPYYAYSQYETDKLDNRIKITNLPQTCTVSIYTTGGILVRKIEKDDPTITSVDWDLKNHARIPISSGIYIIHVEVPDVGEKILKWFGMLRPVDLDAF